MSITYLKPGSGDFAYGGFPKGMEEPLTGVSIRRRIKKRNQPQKEAETGTLLGGGGLDNRPKK